MKMKLTTNMRGLQRFHELHPHKSLKGYFILDGHELTNKEVLAVVNYAVEHGYETEADIPDEELDWLLEIFRSKEKYRKKCRYIRNCDSFSNGICKGGREPYLVSDCYNK